VHFQSKKATTLEHTAVHAQVIVGRLHGTMGYNRYLRDKNLGISSMCMTNKSESPSLHASPPSRSSFRRYGLIALLASVMLLELAQIMKMPSAPYSRKLQFENYVLQGNALIFPTGEESTSRQYTVASNNTIAKLPEIREQQPINPDNICIVTAEFSKTVEDADVLPIVEKSMRRDPPRHFAFTNLESLPVDGWERIVLTDADVPYKRMITKSRWPKFLGWMHPQLKHCQIIFYGDAYFMNPTNETFLMNMAMEIRASDVGLMQDKQPGRRDFNGPIKELQHTAAVGKLSWKAANYTIAWLQNQTDFRKRTRVYKNARFGYDPSSKRYRDFVLDFWNEYSKEVGSWRDQPYWAYFLRKHKMKPLRFPGRLQQGAKGVKGHNGHVYVRKAESK
jgi:hypothetical protein